MANEKQKPIGRLVKPFPGWESVDGVPTFYVELPPIRISKIIVYYADPPEYDHDPGLHIFGTVIFVTTEGERIEAALHYTFFPPGTWTITPTYSAGEVHLLSKPEKVSSKAAPGVIETFYHRVNQGSCLIQWQLVKYDDPEKKGKKLNSIIRASVDQKIPLEVSYHPIDGDVSSLNQQALLAGDFRVLANEELAKIYLEFVEHFANVEVDHSLAKGGLTVEELQKVAAPNPSVIEPMTDLFTQGYVEFAQAQRAASPVPGLDEFTQMAEAIFYQARAKNDLARRNMLRIGIGLIRNGKGKDFKDDIGVLIRPCSNGTACAGDTRRLVYDRHGFAVRGFGAGFIDVEYRSVDLEKLSREAAFPVILPGVPFVYVLRYVSVVEVDVNDRRMYSMLRAIEQDLGSPPREVVALAASLFNYGLFIGREMYAKYRSEVFIGRTIELSIGVFAFFVVHAIAAFFLLNPHPALQLPGFVLLALARVVGAILGVDMALAHMEKLALAGRHFSQMERLHRTSASASGGSAPLPGTPGDFMVELPELEKAGLTRLSRKRHLEKGCEVLLDAMADYFAMGVVLVGGVAAFKIATSKAVGKLSKAIKDGFKLLEEDAHSKLTVNDDAVVTEIAPLKGGQSLERVPVPKAKKGAGGISGDKLAPGSRPKPEKKKPVWGAHFFDRCDAYKKRVEEVRAHLDSVETPKDPERAKKLEELRYKFSTYLPNSIDLMRRKRGERLLPVIAKEIAEFEAAVEREFPRPKPPEPPKESEGRYVIQEPGELQGEPQIGKRPESATRSRKIDTRAVEGVDARTFTYLDVNPGFPGPGRTKNCANCAIALDRTFAGQPTMAEPSLDGFEMAEIEAEAGGVFIKTDLPSIETDLQNFGEGARGIVLALYIDSDAGHAFNAVNVEGKVRFIDAQSREVYDDPSSLFYNWYFLRTDAL